MTSKPDDHAKHAPPAPPASPAPPKSDPKLPQPGDPNYVAGQPVDEAERAKTEQEAAAKLAEALDKAASKK
jgi:hypothetical protein